MSLEGYFESIINDWNEFPDHTPCMLEEMKAVIRQFNESRVYGDFNNPEKELELADKFTEIYNEVYNQ